MSNTTRAIKNSVFILSSRAVQIATSFFLLGAIARYLSVECYGEYSFIIAFVSSVMALTYFGIQQVTIREIAKDKENAHQHLGAAIQLRACLSIVAALTVIISMLFLKFSNLMVTAVIIAIISEFFLTFSMLLKAVFQAFEKMIYEPVIALVYCLVLSVGIGVVIYLDAGLLGLLIATAVSNAVQLAIAARILSAKFVLPAFSINKTAFWTFLKVSSVIGVGIFFYQNLFRIDVLMLKWLGSAEDVAFFQAPHNLIMQIEIIPVALVSAIFPILSRLLHTEPSKAVDVYEKIFRHMFIFSVIFSVYLSLFSSEIIQVVFGVKYANSVTVLTIVSWAVIPLTMDMYLNSVLIAMNKQRFSAIYGGLTLFINFLAALVFIPLYGFIATAYIALASYFILFFFSLYFVSVNGLSIAVNKIVTKTVVAGLISGAIIFALKSVSPFLALPAGIIVYFTVLLKTRAFPMDEIVLIKEKVSRLFSRKEIIHYNE